MTHEATLGRARLLRLPPLGVGLGIYLPMSVTLPVVVGAVTGWMYDRWADGRRDPEAAKRLGVLMATGMIVGESLWGVAYAAIVGASGSDAPLALVGDEFETYALVGGTALLAALVAWMYARTRRAALEN